MSIRIDDQSSCPPPLGEEMNELMDSRKKWCNLLLLAIAEFLAMTLWFSATAVIPQLRQDFPLTTTTEAWLTISVQVGFVMGAFLSALFNISDRTDVRYLFAVCAFLGSVFTWGITVLPVDASAVMNVIVLRILTGVCLACVYPPGMKLMATWCKEDRGLGIGILVGALTVGSAFPHLVNAVPIFGTSGMPPWRSVLQATSGLAVLSGLMVVLLVQLGPFATKSAPFHWRYAWHLFQDKPIRLANIGYLGHMWELYAMWAWAPFFLLESYDNAGWSTTAGRIAGFSTIAIGGLGSVVAGIYADRFGRTAITIISLVVSGTCCILVGFTFSSPLLLTILCLVWGFAVVADSAQFSTAISELADPRYIGSALTLQTSLGFLLTICTIQLIPMVRDWFGWQWVFIILALGPICGCWSMWKLRNMPEATAMASGNR